MSLKRVRMSTPFQLPKTTKQEYLEDFINIEKLKNEHLFGRALNLAQELVDKMNKDETIDQQNYPLRFENPVQEILYRTDHPEYDKESPEQPLAHALYALGALLMENNYVNESIKYLKQAYELAPYSPVMAIEYIEALKATGDFDEAKKVVKEILPKTYELERIAHLIRDLGFIAIEEEDYHNALFFYMLSQKYSDSPVAEQEIDYINSKTNDLNAYSAEKLEDFNNLIEKEGYNLSPIMDIVQTVNDYIEEKEKEGIEIKINSNFYQELLNYMDRLDLESVAIDE